MNDIADAFERQLEAKHARRLKAELRTDERLNRLESKAEKMIGELRRNGQAVYYIYPAGGKYQEGSRIDLISFLIRNRYVR